MIFEALITANIAAYAVTLHGTITTDVKKKKGGSLADVKLYAQRLDEKSARGKQNRKETALPFKVKQKRTEEARRV